MLKPLVALALATAVACGTPKKQADQAPDEPTTEGAKNAVPAQKDDASDPPASSAKPALARADVVGDYTTDGGDFEEVSLAADGTFGSFLHARPFYSGKWTLAGTTLTLETDDGTKIVITDVARTATGLTGKLDTGGDTAWKRIKN